VIIASDPAAAILQMAEEVEADVIALATRGYGAIKRAASGSVSDQVMRTSQVSVLVVHPTLKAWRFETAPAVSALATV
jgi:nucleotide-binding universal stress UspA family protein